MNVSRVAIHAQLVAEVTHENSLDFGLPSIVIMSFPHTGAHMMSDVLCNY